jgi:hypothetical protein
MAARSSLARRLVVYVPYLQDDIWFEDIGLQNDGVWMRGGEVKVDGNATLDEKMLSTV